MRLFSLVLFLAFCCPAPAVFARSFSKNPLPDSTEIAANPALESTGRSTRLRLHERLLLRMAERRLRRQFSNGAMDGLLPEISAAQDSCDRIITTSQETFEVKILEVKKNYVRFVLCSDPTVVRKISRSQIRRMEWYSAPRPKPLKAREARKPQETREAWETCDVITTTDGKKYYVRIQEETPAHIQYVFCDNPDDFYYLPRKNVQHIERASKQALSSENCDQITTRNDDTYFVRIIEETRDSLRYAFCGDSTHTYTLARSKVKQLTHGKDVFGQSNIAKLAHSALICGAVGLACLAFVFTWVASLILAIIALSKGAKALQRINADRSATGKKIRSKAITAVILGSVTLVLLLTAAILLFLFLLLLI